MDADLPGELRRRGFVILRGEIDPASLAEETDRVLADAFDIGDRPTVLAKGEGQVTFDYAPMMCERTPVSLALIDRFSVVAAGLLGRTVLPGRAKATRYQGDTGWHRDSEHDVASIGVVCYLEPLRAATGALRVLPGSHDDPGMRPPQAGTTPGVEVLETDPGDVIVFDEHLIHGSTGGGVRRQWRVDFIIDPRDEPETASVVGWFNQSVPGERGNPGYDAARYPSYGDHWQALDRAWIPRLRDLGVYQLTAR